jgi:hypothetical protein
MELTMSTCSACVSGMTTLCRRRIAVEAERVAAGQIVQRSPFARLALSMLGQGRLASVADRLRHGGFT